MAPRVMSLHAERSARRLEAADHLTFDGLVADKCSTRLELADRVLDDLLKAAKTRTGLIGVLGTQDQRTAEAVRYGFAAPAPPRVTALTARPTETTTTVPSTFCQR
jgi:hypothetical protein